MKTLIKTLTQLISNETMRRACLGLPCHRADTVQELEEEDFRS